MSNLGKCLVVFVTFASLSFMGFAMVTTMAGTDWKEYLAQKRYEGNTLTLSEMVRQQDEEIRRLKDELTAAEESLKNAIATREADMKALKAREDALVAKIDEIHKEIVGATQETTVTGNKVIDVKNQASDRHEEVVRLKNQLEELRAEIQVAREEDNRLADRVVQAEELLKFALRRNQQLKSQLSGS